jgi:hypothetical protein
MPRINLAEYFPQSSAQRTPTVSMHALDAEFEAGRNVANAAAGLAGTAADIVMETRRKVQDAYDKAETGRALAELRRRTDAFVESADERKTRDFDGMAARYTKAFDGWRKDNTLVPQGLSKAAEENYRNAALEFFRENEFMVQKVATAKKIEYSATVQMGLYNEAVESGDEVAALARLDVMESGGLKKPDEIEKLRANTGRAVQLQAGYKMINADPFDAEKKLKAGELKAISPHDRHTLLTTAQVEINKKNIADYQDLQAAFINGENIDARVDALEGAGRLNKLRAANLRQDARQKRLLDPELQKGQYLHARELIAALRPEDRGTKKEAEALAAMLGMTADFHDLAKTALKDALEPKSRVNEPPVMEVRAMMRQNFRDGVYGRFRKVVMETDENGKPVLTTSGRPKPRRDAAGRFVYESDPERLSAAQARYARVYDAAMYYAKKNPNASLEDLKKFITDFDADNITRDGASVLTGPVRPARPDDTGFYSDSEAMMELTFNKEADIF